MTDDPWSNEKSIVPTTQTAIEQPLSGAVVKGGGFGADAVQSLKAMPLPGAGMSVLALAVVSVFVSPALIAWQVGRQSPSAVQSRQIDNLIQSYERLSEEASKPRCVGICYKAFAEPPQPAPAPEPYYPAAPTSTAPSLPMPVQQISATANPQTDAAYNHVLSEWNRAWTGQGDGYWPWAHQWKSAVERGSQDPYAIAFGWLWAEVPESRP